MLSLWSVTLTGASGNPVDDTIPDEQGTDSGSLDETVPLIDPTTQTTLPAGCSAPRVATATFLGELVSVDDVVATYRIVQVRGGSLGAYVNSGLITIRYAERETRYLHVGETYLVGAGANELFPTLESKVREPRQLFGGDAVVGVDESDVPCPRLEDPVLTLTSDGRFVEAGVLTPLLDARNRVLQAVLLPFVFVMVGLIGLVVTKRLFVGAGRGLRSKH